jgi:glucosamine kinase
MKSLLIADSGSTKCEWCWLVKGEKKLVETPGISPYFLDEAQIAQLIREYLLAVLPSLKPDGIFFYGTGCGSAVNRKRVARALKSVFPGTAIEVHHDLTGAARAVCGNKKGVVAILGTGSNSGYYNGHKIVKNSPGIGYVLGDEGSGAYLGRKVLQYYLYGTFDEMLKGQFDKKYQATDSDILDNVYKKPLPNRYIASFALFLAENRGHYMIENIIEDGLNDFFFYHLCKFGEVWKTPVHFVGSVAFGFQDIVRDLCKSYQWETGRIVRKPMDGLIRFHTK